MLWMSVSECKREREREIKGGKEDTERERGMDRDHTCVVWTEEIL